MWPLPGPASTTSTRVPSARVSRIARSRALADGAPRPPGFAPARAVAVRAIAPDQLLDLAHRQVLRDRPPRQLLHRRPATPGRAAPARGPSTAALRATSARTPSGRRSRRSAFATCCGPCRRDRPASPACSRTRRPAVRSRPPPRSGSGPRAAGSRPAPSRTPASGATSRTTTGTSCSPARWAARQRRSPAISS